MINNIGHDTEALIKKYNAGFNITDNLNRVIKRVVSISNKEINSMSLNSKRLYLENFSNNAIQNKINNIFDKDFFNNEKF